MLLVSVHYDWRCACHQWERDALHGTHSNNFAQKEDVEESRSWVMDPKIVWRNPLPINKDQTNGAAHSKTSVWRSIFRLCSGSQAGVRGVSRRSCLNSKFLNLVPREGGC